MCLGFSSPGLPLWTRDQSVLGGRAPEEPWGQRGPSWLPLTWLYLWEPQGVAVHTQPFGV